MAWAPGTDQRTPGRFIRICTRCLGPLPIGKPRSGNPCARIVARRSSFVGLSVPGRRIL